MGKYSNCWWWDKSNGECDEIDAIEGPIGEDEAGIVFNAQDDQGVRIWLHAQGHPSNFGCVKFKPINRDIKFRAWDTKYNVIISWDDISESKTLAILVNNHNRNISNCVLMQYTGMKDKKR